MVETVKHPRHAPVHANARPGSLAPVHDPIRELKTRARLLHRAARAREPDAVKRVAAHPLVRGPDAPEALQRKHCLDVISRELGFRGWQHARRVLTGDPSEGDLGTLLYPPACSGFLNHWFKSHGEARAHQREHGGFVLGYRRDVFVVSAAYIEALGLDPEDADWRAIDRDWIAPDQPDARARLYARLIAARPRESRACPPPPG